jgi:hypothetical protein
MQFLAATENISIEKENYFTHIRTLQLSVAYLVAAAAAAAAAAAKTASITLFSGIVLNMLLFTE